MSHSQLIVLKFGGSVLLNEQRLRLAVHEIYRWRREGWQVLAVVSALAGRTDEIAHRCRALNVLAPLDRASALASGELESSALLGRHLERTGIPARILTPAATDFTATGAPLDADPESIDIAPLQAALGSHGVVVFPGFVARNEAGRTVTLGRGGSDLTALFLAQALRADRCRLIKDVDGLYESDPAAPGPPPRRYASAAYTEALATDGSIVQHKAIRFAQERSLGFELGRFNGLRSTCIGEGATVFENEVDQPGRLRVAILGLGTVGGGVLELLRQLPEHFEIVGAACRSPEKHSDATSLAPVITADARALAASGADVVVEAIGGLDPAMELVCTALGSRSHVVTANKALLAEHGPLLEAQARRAGVRLLGSASVGGVMPALERIRQPGIRSLRGVLNGTSNFILEQLSRGQALPHAIREAQACGLAESDPSRDLDGPDSLDKLLVLAHELNWPIEDALLWRESILDRQEALPYVMGRARHVATLGPKGLRVLVEDVPETDPLHDLPGEWNALVIERDDGKQEVIRGKGAGRWPTAEAVLADLLELSRGASAAVVVRQSEEGRRRTTTT